MKVAVALISTIAIVSVAHAQTPVANCGAFLVSVDQAVTSVKACSDALYIRRDVTEADALCAGALTLTDQAGESYTAAKSQPTGSADQACAVRNKGKLNSLVAALDWIIAYKEIRLDKTKPEPGPFQPL